MSYCNDISLMLLLPLLSTSDNLTLQGTLDVVLVMTLHTLILPYANREQNIECGFEAFLFGKRKIAYVPHDCI